MKYRVEMKSGKIYRPLTADIAMGFIIMKFRYSELRLPAGEILSVKRIYRTYATPPPVEKPEATSGGFAIPILLFFVVFLFALSVFIPG